MGNFVEIEATMFNDVTHVMFGLTGVRIARDYEDVNGVHYHGYSVHDEDGDRIGNTRCHTPHLADMMYDLELLVARGKTLVEVLSLDRLIVDEMRQDKRCKIEMTALTKAYVAYVENQKQHIVQPTTQGMSVDEYCAKRAFTTVFNALSDESMYGFENWLELYKDFQKHHHKVLIGTDANGVKTAAQVRVPYQGDDLVARLEVEFYNAKQHVGYIIDNNVDLTTYKG